MAYLTKLGATSSITEAGSGQQTGVPNIEGANALIASRKLVIGVAAVLTDKIGGDARNGDARRGETPVLAERLRAVDHYELRPASITNGPDDVVYREFEPLVRDGAEEQALATVHAVGAHDRPYHFL